MLSEERIRLMTKAAEFEQKEGRDAFKANDYFRGDYVSFYMVKAAISATLGFIVMVGLWLLYRLEELLAGLHTLDVQVFLTGIVKWYLLFIIVFEIVVFWAYNTKYTKMRQLMKDYSMQLKEIGQLYEREDKRLDDHETIGGPDNDDYTV